MKVLKSLRELEEDNVGITIGNFDGVHVGHRDLLKKVSDDCGNKGRKLCVLSFVPHPMAILKNEKNFLINSYEERIDLLSGAGIDYFVEINFTRDFSNLTPSEFLDRYIITEKVKGIYLGYDFAFGANKEGSFEFVTDYCKDLDVEVFLLDEFANKEIKVSSSSVRKLLLEGEVPEANELLGRSYFLSGRVIKGEGRGRQIGFPTANIELDYGRLIPPRGVYATTVDYKGGTYQSLTNIGFNPTFNDAEELHVETHLLDFVNDIYGEEIQINFLSKIRDEKKFGSVNELIAQISEDVKKRKDIK